MGFGMRKAVLLVLFVFSWFEAFAQPVVNISDTQVVEGNSGFTNAQFSIWLSAPYTNAVTVAFQTFEIPTTFSQPYSATSGSDFIATNGTVTFAPGETNKFVLVQVIGDTINEADEPFGLGLTLQGPGTLNQSSAKCLILDDDPLEVYVNDIAALEGAEGTSAAVPVTVTTYEITEQTVYGVCSPSGGTASANVDYSTYPSTWQIDPGPPRRNLFICSVVINGDATNEDDETFFLNPSLGYGRFFVRPKDVNAPNARGVVFLNQPKCTIINDDFYLSVQPAASNRTQVILYGAVGATHVLQRSSDLVNWTSFSTNTLDSSRQANVIVTNNGKSFYRALRTVTVDN
jgi:hypothetical protein